MTLTFSKKFIVNTFYFALLAVALGLFIYGTILDPTGTVFAYLGTILVVASAVCAWNYTSNALAFLFSILMYIVIGFTAGRMIDTLYPNSWYPGLAFICSIGLLGFIKQYVIAKYDLFLQ